MLRRFGVLESVFLFVACLGIASYALAGASEDRNLPSPNPFSFDGTAITVPPRVADFLVLDKITGSKKIISIHSGKVAEFGTLFVRLHHCVASAPEAVQEETKVFVEIFENPPGGGNRMRRVFNGWMFASSPAINALEHPVYDIWPIACKAAAPGT